MSVANHDLILWLDEPGNGAGSYYKQISFFECEPVETQFGCVLFLGEREPWPSKGPKRTWIYAIKRMNPPVIEGTTRFSPVGNVIPVPMQTA